MPVDANLNLRASGAGALTATETGGFVAVQGGPELDVVVVVPQAAGTSPTCDIDIEYSEDGSTASGDKLTFAQITAAGVYKLPLKLPRHVTHVREKLTVGGSSPDFGAVTVDLGKVDERTD